MSERDKSLSEKLASSNTAKIRGSLLIAEDLRILLHLRANQRRMSVSRTIEELISPILLQVASAPLVEQSAMLIQSRTRIQQRYLDYKRMFRPEHQAERVDGPNPLTDVNWILPRTFLSPIIELANLGGIDPEDLMADMLSEAIPQNNEIK